MKKILFFILTIVIFNLKAQVPTCENVKIIDNSYVGFTAGGVSSTHTYELLSGLNRLMLVGVGGEDVGDRNVTGVTYGGVSMTSVAGLVEDINGNRNNYVEFFYLDESALSVLGNGNHSLVVTNDGNINGYVSNVFVLENVDQDKLIGGSDTDSDDDDLEINLTPTESTDFLVAMGSNGQAANAYSFTGESEIIVEENARGTRNGLVINDSPTANVTNTIELLTGFIRHAAIGFYVSSALTDCRTGCNPIDIVANSYEGFDASGTGSTHNYELLSGSNRMMLVGVGGEDFTGDDHVDEVRYDGETMRVATGLAEDRQGGSRSNFVQFFYLEESELSDIGDGVHTLQIITNGNSNINDYISNVFLLENVNQTKLIGDTDTESGGASLEIDLTATEATDFLIAMGSNAEQSDPYVLSGQTSIVIDENAGDFRNGLVYFNEAVANVEHTLEFEGSLGRHAVAGFTVSEVIDYCPSLGPGGVSDNLVFWIKANDGVDCDTDGCKVNDWEDRSSSVNHVVSSGTPELVEDGLNYNEGVVFVESQSDYFNISSPSKLPLGSAERSFFLVSEATATNQQPVLGYGNFGTLFGRVDLSASIDRLSVRISDNNNLLNHSVSTPYVSTFTYSGGLFNPNFRTYQNGTQLANNYLATIGVPNTQSTEGFIGRNVAKNQEFNGKIYEVIAYDVDITGEINDKEKIESYLAAKYGIIIDHDLIDSEGDLFWDYGTERDVMTIGRDDKSNLYQKQSKSSDDTLQIYVDELRDNNNKNTGDISIDRSFLTFGGSDGYLSGRIDDNGFPIEVPTGVYSIFDRTWRVKNVNFANTYSLDLKFDSIGTFDIADIRLLVSTTDDFTDDASPIVYADGDNGITIETGSIVISGIGTSILPLNETRYFAIGSVSELTPLPIQLLSFTAENIDEYVSLEWATSLEINNDFFTLEKSEDGLNWIEFETVSSQGSAKSITNYSSEDHSPFVPITYYRLKQTDIDGTFTYSKIVAVDFDDQFKTGIEIYPNPSSGHHIHIDVADEITEIEKIEIVDLLGRSIMSEKPHDYVLGQSYKLSFSEKLSSGTYLMRVKLSSGEVHLVTFSSF